MINCCRGSSALSNFMTQVKEVSKEWAERADLPQHVVQLVNNFPSTLHPMSQFSSAIAAMQSESKFAKAYSEGAPKSQYWEVSLYAHIHTHTHTHTRAHTRIHTHTHKHAYTHTH